MWEAVASAPLPMYGHRKDKRKQSKPDIENETSPTSTAPPPPSLPTSASNVAPELLEPAVDGPPSPERLRQLSKQMRGNMLERSHQQQLSSASASSSLRSFTSLDRPSWEQALESVSLSRRSSSRSTASSIPSRERPDSVQIFGKAIFNRRGKSKRESKSSSGSSLHSGDPEAPPTSNPTKDYFIPIVLRRRRATTTAMKQAPIDAATAAAAAAAQQKKIQISGPYNFQHVTHAHREANSEGQSPSGSDTTQQGEAMNPFSNFSSEAINVSGQQQDVAGLAAEPHTRISVTRPLMLRSQTSPPRRLVKKTHSQEQIRVAPPRPPRSPRLEPALPSPPVPPPRVSSRATMHHAESYNPSGERQGAGNGFTQPQPFSPQFEHPLPSMSTPGHGYPSDEMDEYFDPRFSHAITTPDDAAWPLTSMTSSGTLSFENTLPEVPEEEENYYTTTTAMSRLSVTSNSSSLRGSHSVPALRSLAHRQSNASNASDTLGRFDVFATKKALKENMEARGDALSRDNWEDVIDYCYDHEAEADFDYEWSRPSLEMARNGFQDVQSRTPPRAAEGYDEQDEGLSPFLNAPSRFDVPELSPASQTSNAEGDEVLTPVIPQTTSNFSLPRKESVQGQGLGLGQGQPQQRSGKPDRLPHIRTPSHASSFKESHGFNLSPSLLIPNDYHQQMLLVRTEQQQHSQYAQEVEEWVGVEAKVSSSTLSSSSSCSTMGDIIFIDPQATTLNPSLLRSQLRGSVSSIGTESSGGSNGSSRPSETSSSAERHISTTSTSTAYSRFTMSSNPDLDYDSTPLPTSKPGLHSLIKEALSHAMDSSDNVSTVGELPSIPARREHSRNRSVPLNVADDERQQQQRAASPKETIKTRRQRSKTTSSVNGGTPTYGLFPPGNLQGNRF